MLRDARPRARLEGVQVRNGKLGLPIQTIAHDVEEPPSVTVSYRKPTAAEALGGQSVVYPVGRVSDGVALVRRRGSAGVAPATPVWPVTV